jgi:hypothetical protein
MTTSRPHLAGRCSALAQPRLKDGRPLHLQSEARKQFTMSDDSAPAVHIDKPHDHTSTDLFLWHQYQGDNTNDCAAFSVAIVGNAVLDDPHFDGYTVARDLEKPVFVSRPVPHITIFKLPNWATFPWGISRYLTRKGIPARLRWFGNTDRLLRNIQENRFTIVIIGEPLRHEGFNFTGWGHAKVLYGFEPTGPAPKKGFYFVDPGYPKEWSMPRHPQGVFWQDESEFKQQWGNMLRPYVEVGT